MNTSKDNNSSTTEELLNRYKKSYEWIKTQVDDPNKITLKERYELLNTFYSLGI